MAENPNQDAEKTLDPTERKISKALEKGNTVRSQEISHWFMLMSFLLVVSFSTHFATNFFTFFRELIENAHEISIHTGNVYNFVKYITKGFLGHFLLIFSITVAMAIIGNLVQSRPRFTTEKLKIKVSHISLMTGIKRLFSGQSLINFIGGLTKIIIVGVIFYTLLWNNRDILESFISQPLLSTLHATREYIIYLTAYTLILITAFALIDYSYQYHKWYKQLRMSHQEQVDEHKELEGDPKIRAKLRSLRNNAYQKRSIARVATASVLITNPTHYAIALQYDNSMQAPTCVAKGADYLALNMRKIAQENNVPIFENPPLARQLYADIDIDEEIQAQHYAAVAAIISAVLKLGRKKV